MKLKIIIIICYSAKIKDNNLNCLININLKQNTKKYFGTWKQFYFYMLLIVLEIEIPTIVVIYQCLSLFIKYNILNLLYDKHLAKK